MLRDEDVGVGGLARGLIDLLDHFDRVIEAAANSAAPGARLTREQWRVLLLLGDRAGHTMGEVAARAGVPSATATRLIDRLVADALVHRRPDPLDRRKVLVYLTEVGRLRLEEVSATLRTALAKVVAGLDDNDRDQLSRLLNRLTSVLGAT